jgi:hypothetical protein
MRAAAGVVCLVACLDDDTRTQIGQHVRKMHSGTPKSSFYT